MAGDSGDNWDFLGDPSLFGLGNPYDGSFDLNTSGAPTGGGYVPGNVNAGDSEQQLAGDTAANGGVTSGLGGTSIGSLVKQLGSALGINSAGDLAKLAAMIAPFAGALYSNNRTNKAAGQLNNAINTANTTLTDAYGKAATGFQPYADAGKTALANAPGMMFKPTNYGGISPQFQPLGAGRGLTLGNIAKG